MIYINIDNINIKVETKNYNKLSDNFKEWIDNNTIHLYKNSTPSEKKTSSILKSLKIIFGPQVFMKKMYCKTCLSYDPDEDKPGYGVCHLSECEVCEQ